jgi:hypothetical protein
MVVYEVHIATFTHRFVADDQHLLVEGGELVVGPPLLLMP